MAIQHSAINKIQHQHVKGSVERLPPIGNASSLADGVKEFLKDREHLRKITRAPVTKLERFLNQTWPKMWNWNVGNLLEEIEKWAEGVKQKESTEVDMWRIRSSVARKFSDFMDQPQSLLRPSKSLRSEESLWSKLESKNLHSGKYGSLG